MSTESLQGATKRYSQGSCSSSGEEQGVSETGKFQRKKTSKVYPTKQLRSLELASNKSKSKSLEEDYEKTISRVKAYESLIGDIDDTNRDDVRTLACEEDISEHKSSDSLAKTTVEPKIIGAEGGIDIKEEDKVFEETADVEDTSDDTPELKSMLESLKLKGDETSFIILLGLMRIWIDREYSDMEKEGTISLYDGPPLFSTNLEDTDFSPTHRKEACKEVCSDIAGRVLNFWLSIGSLFKKHGLSKIICKLKEEQKKLDGEVIASASDQATQAATMAFKATTFEKIKCKAISFFGLEEKSPYAIIEEQKTKLEEFNKAFEKLKNRSLVLNPLLAMLPGISGCLNNAMLILKTCRFTYNETLQMILTGDLLLEIEIPSFDKKSKICASLSVHDAEFVCDDWLAELITRFVELGGDLNFIPALATRIFSQMRKLPENLDQGEKCLYQVRCGRLDLVVDGVDESHHVKSYLEKLEIGIGHTYPPDLLNTAVYIASCGKTTIVALGDLRGFICDLCVQVAHITREVCTYHLGNEKNTEEVNASIRDNLKFTTDICTRVGHQVSQHLPKVMMASCESTRVEGRRTYAYLKEHRRHSYTLTMNGLTLMMKDAQSTESHITMIKVGSFINTMMHYLHHETPFDTEPTMDGRILTSVQEYTSQSSIQEVECALTMMKAKAIIEFSIAMLLVQDKSLYNRLFLPKFKDHDVDLIHRCKEKAIKLLEHMAESLQDEHDDAMLSLKADRIGFNDCGGYLKENPLYLYCHLLADSEGLQLEKIGEEGAYKIFTADIVKADWLTKPDSFGHEVALLKPYGLALIGASFNWGDDNHTAFSFGAKDFGRSTVDYITTPDKVEHESLVKSKLEKTIGFIYNGTVSVIGRALSN